MVVSLPAAHGGRRRVRTKRGRGGCGRRGSGFRSSGADDEGSAGKSEDKSAPNFHRGAVLGLTFPFLSQCPFAVNSRDGLGNPGANTPHPQQRSASTRSTPLASRLDATMETQKPTLRVGTALAARPNGAQISCRQAAHLHETPAAAPWAPCSATTSWKAARLDLGAVLRRPLPRARPAVKLRPLRGAPGRPQRRGRPARQDPARVRPLRRRRHRRQTRLKRWTRGFNRPEPFFQGRTALLAACLADTHGTAPCLVVAGDVRGRHEHHHNAKPPQHERNETKNYKAIFHPRTFARSEDDFANGARGDHPTASSIDRRLPPRGRGSRSSAVCPRRDQGIFTQGHYLEVRMARSSTLLPFSRKSSASTSGSFNRIFVLSPSRTSPTATPCAFLQQSHHGWGKLNPRSPSARHARRAVDLQAGSCRSMRCIRTKDGGRREETTFVDVDASAARPRCSKYTASPAARSWMEGPPPPGPVGSCGPDATQARRR